MNITVSLSRLILRASFPILLVLGALFWHGEMLQLLPLHMALGALFVLTLWVLGICAGARRETRGRGLLLIILGLAVISVGVGQLRLLPGANHWVIQVVHLALGVAAIALAERVASRLRSAAGLRTRAANES